MRDTERERQDYERTTNSDWGERRTSTKNARDEAAYDKGRGVAYRVVFRVP